MKQRPINESALGLSICIVKLYAPTAIPVLQDVKASIQRKTLRAVQVCRDPNELAKKLDDASKAGAVESKISVHDALALMSVLMEDGRGSFRGAYRKQLLYEQELEGQNEEGETKMRPRLQK